jgi:aminopeptidase N
MRTILLGNLVITHQPIRSNVHHQEIKTAYTATVYVKQLLLPAAIEDEIEPDSSR